MNWDNDKKKMLFYTIFGVAILIMVVVGATYAFFEAVISSDDNSVNVDSLDVSLLLEEDTSYIKSNLYPATEDVVNDSVLKTGEDKCLSGDREVCSAYTFTVINPSFQSPVPITMTLNPIEGNNEFHNLYYRVYRVIKDSNGIVQYTEVIPSTKLNYQDYSAIVLDKLDTYTPASTNTTRGEVSYEIVMWLKEINEDQSELDGNKTFKATINVSSGYKGVKGLQASFLFNSDDDLSSKD